MKETTKMILVVLLFIFFCSLLIIAYWQMTIYLEKNNFNCAKEHPTSKVGKIILVIPPSLRSDNDGVYFSDGSILDEWRDQDYTIFRNYIDKEVVIQYGNIPYGQSWTDERILLSISEVKP